MGLVRTLNLPILTLALTGALSLMPAGSAGTARAAGKPVVLYAAEQLPYLGPSLPGSGYVGQMVTEAFRRAGYKATLQFYPPKRAMLLARSRLAAGFLPIYRNPEAETDFTLSRPFPGSRLVLARKVGQPLKGIPDGSDALALLRPLSAYRVGYTVGTSIPAAFSAAPFRMKDTSTTDLENLDKLMGDRLDFIAIDKLALGDLMVRERPHYIGKLKVFATLAKHDFHVGFPKGAAQSDKLRAAFDQQITRMEQDGTLAGILRDNGIYADRADDAPQRKIVIGTPNNTAMLTMRKLTDQYRKLHPDVGIEWRIMDEKTLRVRLLTDLAVSDNQFDIVTIGAYETQIWAKNGWLAPIENLSAQYDVGDVIGSVRSALSSHGVLYGLPFYAESSMTYFRKDLVEQAGLTMPDAPTYADIRRIAAAIHDPAHQRYGICLRGDAGWGSNMAYVTTLVNTAGGRWFDERWTPTIDTPEWRLALQTYKELLTLYGPPQPADNNYQRNLELFKGGHCGIWIDATVFAGDVMDVRTSSVADKVAFTRAPILVTPKGAHWLWTWAMAIPKASKNAGEAQRFIEWATSKDYTELVARTEGWLNVPSGIRTSTYNNPQYRASAPFADMVLRAINEADPNASLRPRPYTGIQYVSIPEFVSIGDKMGQLVSEVIAGQRSVDDALKAGQEMADRQMRVSKYLH